jgi:uncharacterized protein
MNPATNRITISAIVVLIWVAITIFGGIFLNGGETSLSEGVSHSIAWNILAAALFIGGAILVFGWKDMRFQAPLPGSLKALWFPALYLIAFLAASLAAGLPPFSVMAFVFINTLLVGFSEEAAFRGVVYRALRTRSGIWTAVIISSLLFGSVHILNLFTTGQVAASFLQATTAAMSGFVMVAILLRTGSIIVAMIYHALWDFGTFVFSASMTGLGGESAAATTGPTNPLFYLFPIALVLPNFLYALWLLKNLPKHPDAMARA